MSYSASRLTLYAVLSAIEADLRRVIWMYLDSDLQPEGLFGEDSHRKASERFERDGGDSSHGLSLEEVLRYVDFGDLIGALNRHRARLPEPVGQYVKSVSPILEKLIPIRNRIAHVRPLNFDDLPLALDVAEELLRRRDGLWADLRDATNRLAKEPSFVHALTIPAYELESDARHNLPTPDFDETGFVGRVQEVRSVVKACLGPFPIITIVGEGGVGKTALALKAAYEVLDSKESRFDAVVWTSSKTTQLTPTEIIRIEGAIRDSLGMMRSVAEELAGDVPGSPLEEVLAYLREFRILLVLDNLETVLDERLRDFLQQLPAGSKVLITSRIGLGALDYPMKLNPMTPEESAQLLRALAKIRGLNQLAQAPSRVLAGYARRMKYNPGFVRWFVSAVQAGKRPEDILSKPELFLDFCMSNVYEYLSKEARNTLNAMVSIPGRHSQGELAVLTEADASSLQEAIHQLLTTNMITMETGSREGSAETRYEVSDLARAYLTKHHPVPPENDKRFRKHWKQLIAAGERFKAEQEANPYSLYRVIIRNRGDLPAAKYLTDAIDSARNGDFEEAHELVENARQLSPDYFEVYRVKALTHVLERNYPSAREAYEAAVELAQDHAPLRFWYGGFLMRYQEDIEGALKQLTEAYRRDRIPMIQMEIARAHLWISDFHQAQQHIGQLMTTSASMSEWQRRKLIDLRLQFSQRAAEHFLALQENEKALYHLHQMREIWEGCPRHLRDAGMKDKLGKALPTMDRCRSVLYDSEVRRAAEELGDWFSEELSIPEGDAAFDLPPGYYLGVVERYVVDRGFGFIRRADGRSFFVHITSFPDGITSADVTEGSEVFFREGRTSKGPCALDVTMEPPTAPPLASDSSL